MSSGDAAGERSTSAFSFVIPTGSYPLSGTFSPPNSFSVSGSFPGTGPFFVSGQIPTNGGNGNYTIVTSGQTVNGNFATGNVTPTPGATTSLTATATARPTTTTTGTQAPTATATTAPTATATARPTASATPTVAPTASVSGNNRVEAITFSAISGANAANTSPFSATLPNNSFFRNNGQGFQGTAFFESRVGGITRKLTFEGPIRGSAVSAGETFAVGGGEGGELANVYYSEVASSGVERSWEGRSGTYAVVSGDANKVSFSLQNVRFGPAFNSSGARGTFTLNGRGSVGR